MTGTDSETERMVGDYRLTERISDDGRTATWLAEQVSVKRIVSLDELLELSSDSRERFLSDTRARASVDHPFVASVYEAVDAERHCFRASERLTGTTLEAMLKANTRLEPVHMTRVLRCIAEANLHHETNARATLPLSPGDIHVDGREVTRIANLAVVGHRGDGDSARDVEHLGCELMPLVAPGRPGSTRVFTVLAWMRGKERPAPLQWREIIDLCDQIDRQLSTPVGAANRPATGQSPRGAKAFLLLGGFTVAALAVIMLLALLLRPAQPGQIARDRPAPVLIPAGGYPAHDGSLVTHDAFLIDARETTIGEYREFLETLVVLIEGDRHRIFDHPGQPPEKSGHEPDDWPALLAAARAQGRWKDKTVTLDSPVPGVDWWDAMAYANWRKARLPSEEEWSAAIHHECEDPAAIPAGPWHARVPGDDCTDRTPAGILGAAGSLGEWTRGTSISPANPLGRPQHIIVGGSYLRRDGHALTREWTADPGLRRTDLGFRLVRDIADEGE